MSDSIYAPPKADLTRVQSDDSTEAFYVVSTMKMMVLFLTTMGGYQLYWHYKNWRRHQQWAASQGEPDGDIWPVPRAIFCFLFIHSLFGKVKQHATVHQRPNTFNTALKATLMVCIMFFGLTMLIFKGPQALLMIAVTSLILIVPQMFLYRSAQRFINETCGDPEGKTNADFTVANYIWIALGLLDWLYNIRNVFKIARLF